MSARRQVVLEGNNLEILARMPDCSVHAVVTDPPYGLGFMNKDWDAALPDPRTWSECLRVLRPGGHLVAFGAPRLVHRLTCQIEDAGFEVRDCLMWLTGQGFPKGLNVVRELASLGQCQLENVPHAVQVSTLHHLESSEGTARIAAALVEIRPEGERALITQTGTAVALLDLTAMSPSESEEASTVLSMLSSWSSVSAADSKEVSKCITSTACATTIDQKTLNWLIGQTTSETTTLAHVTLPSGEQWPAINAESRSSAARSGSTLIPIVTAVGPATWNPVAAHKGFDLALKPSYEPIVLARKPLSGTVAANVLTYGTGAINVDACRVAAPDPEAYAAKGASVVGLDSARNTYGAPNAPREDSTSPLGRWPANLILDEDAGAMLGEPARFFYCPKASRSEREAGLEDLPEVRRTDGRKSEHHTPNLRTSARRNHHATVKPVALMRWLIRLVTPPGGIVLEPFAGSGSTLVAAALEDVDAIGMEIDPEYCTIARARVAHARRAR